MLWLLQSKERILKKDWLGAVAARSNLTRILRAMSGLATLEDVRKSVDYFTDANGTDYLTAFVNLETVKKALGAHTNITWTQCSDLVDEKMQVGLVTYIDLDSALSRILNELHGVSICLYKMNNHDFCLTLFMINSVLISCAG